MNVRRVLPICVALALSWAWPRTHAAENLIKNPSFEETTPGGAIPEWTVNPPWYADAKAKEKGLASVVADELPCAKIAVTIPNTKRLEVHLRSQSALDVEGVVAVSVPQGWAISPASQRCALGKGAARTLPFDLAMPDAPAQTPGPIEVVFQTDRQGRVAMREEPRFFVVRRLSRPPEVDGNVNEFMALPAIRLDSAEMLGPSADPAANKLWTGHEDLSVEVWAGWDDRNFYLAARVHDDKHVQTRTGSLIWQQDCLQIALDPLNDALPANVSGRAGFDPDDHEFGLALTPKGPVLWRWAGGDAKQSGAQPGTRLAIQRQEGVTTYEWAIPWEALAPAKPVAGAILGMSFITPDADEDRDATYWMRLSDGIANGKTPALYPNFILAE